MERGEGATGRPPVADRPSDLWRQYLPPERRESAASLASYVGGLNVIRQCASHVSLAKVMPEAYVFVCAHVCVCVATETTGSMIVRKGISGDDRGARRRALKRTRNSLCRRLPEKCSEQKFGIYRAIHLVVIHFLFISNGKRTRTTHMYVIHTRRAYNTRCRWTRRARAFANFQIFPARNSLQYRARYVTDVMLE